eukprot:1523954-Prorocentrum_lima.AAC.1
MRGSAPSNGWATHVDTSAGLVNRLRCGLDNHASKCIWPFRKWRKDVQHLELSTSIDAQRRAPLPMAQ